MADGGLASLPASDSGRKRILWTVLVVGALAMIIALAWWITGGFGRVTVDDILAGEGDIDVTDATDALCPEAGCSEARQTTWGAFLEFDNDGQAERWATVIGDDGRRWNNIVLDMRGVTLSFDERKWAIDVLYSYKDWS